MIVKHVSAEIDRFAAAERKGGVADWNTYAMVAIIELARTERENPKVPDWLAVDYFRSIQELAEMGAKQILRTEDSETIRAILGVIAIVKGLRTYGRFLVEYSEPELLDMGR